MSRVARVDIPGQIYHVMSRGIERRKVFRKEEDYLDFKRRLTEWLTQTGSKCLAWCLMPNHFHLLVLRGVRPLSELMHHVMTGYAVNFNLRNQRVGHLFQNRYKAVICDSNEYLMEVVPYIHLNPLRAKLVESLGELVRYKWCGHGAVLGAGVDGVLHRDVLLGYFADTEAESVEKYIAAVSRKIVEAKNGMPAPFGRSSLPSAGEPGWREVVGKVLRAVEETGARPRKSREGVLLAVETATGVPKEDILRTTRARGPAGARAIYCYLCREEAGVLCTELARELGITQGAVSQLIARGRLLAGKTQILIN